MSFKMPVAPPPKGCTVTQDGVRVSVLSNDIIRIERGVFTDKPTQTVVCRNFANPQFITHKASGELVIETETRTFYIDIATLRVKVKFEDGDGACATNSSSESQQGEVKSKESDALCEPSVYTNLGGTARTLDGTFGVLGSWKTKLKKKDHFALGHIRTGIFASNGVSEFDDTNSFLLEEDGSISKRGDVDSIIEKEEEISDADLSLEELADKIMRERNVKARKREQKEKVAKRTQCDKYIFAFGKDYLGGLKEFYALTGATPILPKYALSNWWSRYHKYSADEYLALMDRFEKENLPFSVATIDMDWHIVENAPKDAEYKSFQGAGWTGYTFEKSLFPDYKAFLKNLKDRGLAITMNLHPRDGVRYFEEMYPDMARACGIDPNTKQTVEFDLTDEKFLKAYFEILHHPYEKDGVDFWWIDWQQGTKSKMEGLDPLWMLNHYHYLDSARDGKKGLILSRYAGLGSHRYPLGFSGDAVVCWNSLKFQPYFTALASNAGYTWWSHDIGGHLFGRGNEELYLRWLQFGVFSPINRLHSNNKAWSKEPWLYPSVEEIAKDFLRLRHRLLPYLYSANVKTSKDGVPLVCPAYYYSEDKAFAGKKWRNEYFFGENLFVCPVTKKGKNGVTKMKIYLPEGEWTHFFTGEMFEGGKEIEIECPLNIYPVFAKKGAIVPMLKEREGNSLCFDELEVKIFAGEGEYVMFDENGSIAFEMRECEGGYKLKIETDGEIETKKMDIVLFGGKFENGENQMSVQAKNGEFLIVQ